MQLLIASLTAAALLAITQPFQQGLEAYKAGNFAEAAAALERASGQAGTNHVEMAEAARIWSAAARARAGEAEGLAALKSAYASASNGALRELSFELWREAGREPEDLAPARSPGDTLLLMKDLAASGQIARAENMIGPPLSDLLATWRRISGETDSPLDVLQDMPISAVSAARAQWPEGRSVVTFQIEGMIDVDSEFRIRPDGWALTRILGVRHNPVAMMGAMADIDGDVNMVEIGIAEDGPGMNRPDPRPPAAPDTESGQPDPPPDEDRKFQAWVKDLSSPDAAVRIQARTSLREAGVAAYPALRRALKHPDPEVSETARELLP